MAITTMTDNLDIIAALADTPNDTSGLTAAQLKAKFDEAGNTVKEYINDTLIPGVEQAIGDAEMHNGNIPSGGTTGQALIKTSDDDYDATWHDPTGDSAATPNTIMKRDASGNASVATPTESCHVANKEYADRFSQIGDTISTTRVDLGANWLLCNGASIDEATYPALSALINPHPAGRYLPATVDAGSSY